MLKYLQQNTQFLDIYDIDLKDLPSRVLGAFSESRYMLNFEEFYALMSKHVTVFLISF